MHYKLIGLRNLGKEKRGFVLDRLHGTPDYLLLNFQTPVNLWLDGVMTQVEKGGGVIFEPNQKHFFESPDCTLVHNWVHFIPENASIFKQLAIPVNSLIMLYQTEFITLAVRECESEFLHCEPFWQEHVDSIMNSMFIRMARQLLRNTDPAYQSAYTLGMLKNFKELRLTMYGSAECQWNVNKMADALNLSRSRFSVLYKSFFHVSPGEDIITARLERAMHLLNAGSFSIEAIAEQSGYANTTHFIRQFKAMNGLSPERYRKNK